MNNPSTIQTIVSMGTFVTIEVLGDAANFVERNEAIQAAFGWFSHVEKTCTRFNPQSELMQLCAQVGTPVPLSPVLYYAVEFALAVADQTRGAFDPTVGHSMARRGFSQEYGTGQIVETQIDDQSTSSFRDIRLDPERRSITVLRPLILDLGAVAKGLAIDLAARELQSFKNFAIDAGGDLYLSGVNSKDDPWSIGIRHPRHPSDLFEHIRVSDRAVCTSGDYERTTSAEHGGHHILDPRTNSSPRSVASVTAIAPSAMLADALATAAFVLGPAEGIQLLERIGADGLIVSAELERFETRGMRGYCKHPGVLPHAEGPDDHSLGNFAGSRRAC